MGTAQGGPQAPLTIGPNASISVGDLTLAADRQRLFEAIGSRHGKLEIVVANAGFMESGTLEDIREENFDRAFDLNVKAALFTVQSAASLLVDGGNIVLIGSVATQLRTAGFGVYAASKAAVRSYARTWASEFAARRIRVNTLSPGPVQTAMYDSLSETVRNNITASIPLGRPGRPEEIAATALFLASDEASFVTGIELFADGGMTQV